MSSSASKSKDGRSGVCGDSMQDFKLSLKSLTLSLGGQSLLLVCLCTDYNYMELTFGGFSRRGVGKSIWTKVGVPSRTTAPSKREAEHDVGHSFDPL